MFMRRLLALVALFAAAFIFGCGNAAGLFPVSGQVNYKGEPARGAVVYFHREGGGGAKDQPIPSGVVQDDGSFELESDSLGHGALPGAYSVLVEWRDEKGDGVTPVKTGGKTKLVKRSRMRTGPDRLKGRYLDIQKPRLHAEVKPQSNPLPPFELID
jgi:hypothetical protein